MLRLVDRAVDAAPDLRRVGLYGLERELERYVVHTLRAEWAPAVQALEQGLALARERRSSLDTEAWHLARLWLDSERSVRS